MTIGKLYKKVRLSPRNEWGYVRELEPPTSKDDYQLMVIVSTDYANGGTPNKPKSGEIISRSRTCMSIKEVKAMFKILKRIGVIK